MPRDLKHDTEALLMLATEYHEMMEAYRAKQADTQSSPRASGYGHSRRRSGSTFDGSKWWGGLAETGTAKIADHYALRRNTRNEMYDSTQANAIVNRMVDTEIETGLILEPTPEASILGLSDQQAEQIGDELGSRFASWANSKESTIHEQQNFYQTQWLCGMYQQRDNDFLTKLEYSNRRDLMNPLQIDIVDPDQLQGYAYTYTDGLQNPTHDGIERDKRGKEIAYWLTVMTENNVFEQRRVPAYGTKSGRRFMLHSYRPEFSNQGRGYSLFAHALQNFENLTDFELSHIKKAINQSQVPLYVLPSKDADASDPLDEIKNRYAQPSRTVSGIDPQHLEEATDDEIIQFLDVPEATMTTPGSMFIGNLKKGQDLKVGDQNAPIQSYDTFVDSFTSYLSASRGMPIEVLLMRFNQNYSASRATLLLFWRLVKMWRANLVADILHPVYVSWLSEEIASGRVSLPGWSDPRMKAAWISGRWNGSEIPNIDPLKAALASKQYAELGALHLDSVATELNGSSGRMNRAKLTKQYTELATPPWAAKTGGPDDG